MAEAAHPVAADPVAENLTEAKHGEGMPVRETGGHAVTAAEGGVGPTGAHHPDPAIFGLDATVWVSIAMTVFILILVWKKVPALITRASPHTFSSRSRRSIS